MNDLKLGQLINEARQRDAVHVAVAPVFAAESLLPGQPVGFVAAGDVEHVCSRGEPVGIVDPFLKAPVRKGERFWLFLFPGSITGLRHDWRHPAFAATEEPKPKPAENPAADSKVQSEAWLRVYAQKANCYDDAETAFARLIDGLKHNELSFYGSDLHSLYELDDADDLKFHAERYLGIEVNWDRFSFSCSC